MKTLLKRIGIVLRAPFVLVLAIVLLGIVQGPEQWLEDMKEDW